MPVTVRHLFGQKGSDLFDGMLPKLSNGIDHSATYNSVAAWRGWNGAKDGLHCAMAVEVYQCLIGFVPSPR